MVHVLRPMLDLLRPVHRPMLAMLHDRLAMFPMPGKRDDRYHLTPAHPHGPGLDPSRPAPAPALPATAPAPAPAPALPATAVLHPPQLPVQRVVAAVVVPGERLARRREPLHLALHAPHRVRHVRHDRVLSHVVLVPRAQRRAHLATQPPLLLPRHQDHAPVGEPAAVAPSRVTVRMLGHRHRLVHMLSPRPRSAQHHHVLVVFRTAALLSAGLHPGPPHLHHHDGDHQHQHDGAHQDQRQDRHPQARAFVFAVWSRKKPRPVFFSVRTKISVVQRRSDPIRPDAVVT